jgi:hypothetical protein
VKAHGVYGDHLLPRDLDRLGCGHVDVELPLLIRHDRRGHQSAADQEDQPAEEAGQEDGQGAQRLPVLPELRGDHDNGVHHAGRPVARS